MTLLSADPFADVAAAAAAGRWDEARAALCLLQERSGTAMAARIQSWSLRLAPYWWAPLSGPGVQLRRCRAEDADFYRNCFASRDFAEQFNRQQPWSGDLAKALAKAGNVSPPDVKAMHWIVADGAGAAIGLATLTSLNLTHRRAEFSIGFPRQVSNLHSTTATLLAFHFAFFVARLNKLTAYVYRGNERALHNARRIGFQLEGLLKDHFYLPPGEFVDVHVLGLTREQLLANDHLLRVAGRRLRVRWSDQPGP
jgi:RimJ/RimL family protein N-acetyltransferase